MNLKLDFMRWRSVAMGVSCLLIVASVVSVLMLGLNRGLDFTGGALIEVRFDSPTDPAVVRKLLESRGYINAIVQNLGTEEELVIRVPPIGGIDQSNVGNEVQRVLQDDGVAVELRRAEFVGPTVGAELAEKGGLALLVALGVVMVYIMLRFTGKFSIGAVAALLHDVVIVVGIFSMFQWTFNLPELAALLAVIGYSLNDTIVVSDRIRENFRSVKRGASIEIINKSLNQTLGRTLVTSLTTSLVLAALLFAGGEQIRGFATALTIGVIVGTYSSIYVAASILQSMGIASEELAIPEKDETTP